MGKPVALARSMYEADSRAVGSALFSCYSLRVSHMVWAYTNNGLLCFVPGEIELRRLFS